MAFEKRKLFAYAGYPGFFEYAVRELKSFAFAAQRRIQAMRLPKELSQAATPSRADLKTKTDFKINRHRIPSYFRRMVGPCDQGVAVTEIRKLGTSYVLQVDRIAIGGEGRFVPPDQASVPLRRPHPLATSSSRPSKPTHKTSPAALHQLP